MGNKAVKEEYKQYAHVLQSSYKKYKQRYMFQHIVLLQAYDELEYLEDQELRAERGDRKEPAPDKERLPSTDYTTVKEASNDLLTQVDYLVPKNMDANVGPRVQECIKVINGELCFSKERDLDVTFVKVVIDSYIKRIISSDAEIRLLAPGMVFQIAQLAIDMMSKLQNVEFITLAPKECINVVGDLHGQINDLLQILQKKGLPSASRKYLFNGDFVDRLHDPIRSGKWGCDIVTILFLLKLTYPKYGGYLFRRECAKKFPIDTVKKNYQSGPTFFKDYKLSEKRNNFDVFHLFSEAFTHLPVAHVINKKLFVVHAGPPADLDLTIPEINKLDRRKFCFSCRTRLSAQDQKEIDAFTDMLWSDPRKNNQKGCVSNDQRGCSYQYDKAHVVKFLELNGLTHMVRSHERKDRGHDSHFGRICRTVFSASNYCGDTENQGAVLTYTTQSFEAPQVWEFYAKNRERLRGFKVLRNSLQRCVINKISLRIVAKLAQIKAHFKGIAKDGVVSEKEWAKGMEEVLNLPVAWLKLQTFLGMPRADQLRKAKKVHVPSFLEYFDAGALDDMELGKGKAEECEEQLSKAKSKQLNKEAANNSEWHVNTLYKAYQKGLEGDSKAIEAFMERADANATIEVRTAEVGAKGTYPLLGTWGGSKGGKSIAEYFDVIGKAWVGSPDVFGTVDFKVGKAGDNGKRNVECKVFVQVPTATGGYIHAPEIHTWCVDPESGDFSSLSIMVTKAHLLPWDGDEEAARSLINHIFYLFTENRVAKMLRHFETGACFEYGASTPGIEKLPYGGKWVRGAEQRSLADLFAILAAEEERGVLTRGLNPGTFRLDEKTGVCKGSVEIIVEANGMVHKGCEEHRGRFIKPVDGGVGKIAYWSMDNVGVRLEAYA